MKFSKGEIQAVLAATSKDSSRYNLNGLRVEAGCMVSTDGHRLHRVTIEPEDGAPEFEPFIFSRDSADRLAKSMTAKTAATVTAATDFENSATFETNDGATFKGETIDGEFPNYGQVIPSKKPARTVRINARYLKELCAALIQAEKGLEVEGSRGQVMTRESFVDIELGEDELTAVHFKGAAGRFDGVIMPVRKA